MQNVKKRPRQKLSPLQVVRLRRILVVVALALICWLLFAPGMGLMAWRKQGRMLEEMQAQKAKLEQENKDLETEIDRLHNDIEYLEKIAREKEGLLKNDEIIFDFSKEKK